MTDHQCDQPEYDWTGCVEHVTTDEVDRTAHSANSAHESGAWGERHRVTTDHDSHARGPERRRVQDHPDTRPIAPRLDAAADPYLLRRIASRLQTSQADEDWTCGTQAVHQDRLP